jgi:hypothetical protein
VRSAEQRPSSLNADTVHTHKYETNLRCMSLCKPSWNGGPPSALYFVMD